MIVKPKILFFDIETSPLQAWIWSPGKQYVGHKQLVRGRQQHGIICITYCWNDGKKAKCIDWGYEEQNTAKVVEEFDAIIKQADFVIGKNSDKFDVKMINAARMFAGLPGNPAWSKYTDDLEKQMRKYFRLPSQSLDFISGQLGLGGKIKMEFEDWINICEKNGGGLKAFKKMCKYGMKDVEDTRTLWNKLSEHFDHKFNMSTYNEIALACKHCGSEHLKKDGLRRTGKMTYQQWHCLTCHHYAGRTTCSGGKIG